MPLCWSSSVAAGVIKPTFNALLRFVHAKDSNSSTALGILACLCHNNYLVGKLLLASMTVEERKDLYASSFEDAKTKVTCNNLFMNFLAFPVVSKYLSAKKWKLSQTLRPTYVIFIILSTQNSCNWKKKQSCFISLWYILYYMVLQNKGK